MKLTFMIRANPNLTIFGIKLLENNEGNLNQTLWSSRKEETFLSAYILALCTYIDKEHIKVWLEDWCLQNGKTEAPQKLIILDARLQSVTET